MSTEYKNKLFIKQLLCIAHRYIILFFMAILKIRFILSVSRSCSLSLSLPLALSLSFLFVNCEYLSPAFRGLFKVCILHISIYVSTLCIQRIVFASSFVNKFHCVLLLHFIYYQLLTCRRVKRFCSKIEAFSENSFI